MGNHNGFHKLAVQDNGFAAVVVVVVVLTSISFPYSFISYKAFCLTRLFLSVSVLMCVCVCVCVSLGHVLVFVQRDGQFWFSHSSIKKLREMRVLFCFSVIESVFYCFCFVLFFSGTFMVVNLFSLPKSHFY